MSAPIQYASFLIRIWRENKAGEVSPSADWHAEVKHIQSNQCWTFETVDDLLASLRQQAEDIPADDHSDGNKPSLREVFPERQKE